MLLADYAVLFDCLAGPAAAPDPPMPPECADLCLTVFDSDEDGDVDLEDMAWFQGEFGG